MQAQRALWRGVDEIPSPPERDRLLRQAERRHDLVDVLLKEVFREVRELLLIRAVVRVDRPRTPNLLKRKIPAGIGGQGYLKRKKR